MNVDRCGFKWRKDGAAYECVLMGGGHTEHRAMSGATFSGVLFTIDMPGAFDSYFSGTGIGQGQDLEDNADRALYDAYRNATRIRSGKGYRLRMTVDLDGAASLAEYCDFCIGANSQTYGENINSELQAARKLLERIEDATGGRVRHDGWNVLLDGERIT